MKALPPPPPQLELLPRHRVLTAVEPSVRDRTVDRTRLSGGSATSGTRRSGDGFTTNSFEVLERGGGPSGRRRLEAKRRVGAGVRAPTWLAGEAAQVLVQAVVAS